MMKSSWQVATAAEAFAAGQFARCGWGVFVQYGANQPEYDLVAVNGDKMLKISVKGSAWVLVTEEQPKTAGPLYCTDTSQETIVSSNTPKAHHGND